MLESKVNFQIGIEIAKATLSLSIQVCTSSCGCVLPESAILEPRQDWFYWFARRQSRRHFVTFVFKPLSWAVWFGHKSEYLSNFELYRRLNEEEIWPIIRRRKWNWWGHVLRKPPAEIQIPERWIPEKGKTSSGDYHSRSSVILGNLSAHSGNTSCQNPSLLSLVS